MDINFLMGGGGDKTPLSPSLFKPMLLMIMERPRFVEKMWHLDKAEKGPLAHLQEMHDWTLPQGSYF